MEKSLYLDAVPRKSKLRSEFRKIAANTANPLVLKYLFRECNAKVLHGFGVWAPELIDRRHVKRPDRDIRYLIVAGKKVFEKLAF